MPTIGGVVYDGVAACRQLPLARKVDELFCLVVGVTRHEVDDFFWRHPYRPDYRCRAGRGPSASPSLFPLRGNRSTVSARRAVETGCQSATNRALKEEFDQWTGTPSKSFAGCPN